MIYSAVSFTPEGGVAIRLLNKSGSASVRGTLVSGYGSVNMSFTTAAIDSDMPIGFVYDAGIADGSPCRVIVAGVAHALLKNTVAATRGYVVYASDTAGRVDTAGSIPSNTQHWRECGHCLESVTGGTDKLARIVVHFN